jgi:1-acyl-sn-glycerol-3-phosphate acyltransferase
MLAKIRGAVFYALFYTLMGVVGVALFVPAALSRGAARWTSKRFFALSFLLLRVVGGARIRRVGPIPDTPVIVAAKHQSMLDVFILFHALPDARFVMKRELLRAPIFGWYARRVGAVPVDRGGGSAAMRAMMDELLASGGASAQIVIYPQGTRVPPGEHKPYKVGVHALYEATGLPCVPVAVNTGKILPRGLAVRPGTAVVKFLPPIAPGLAREPFMALLEAVIEDEAAALG